MFANLLSVDQPLGFSRSDIAVGRKSIALAIMVINERRPFINEKLDDTSLVLIFEFLGSRVDEESEFLEEAKAAARVETQLSSVCKRWKTIYGKHRKNIVQFANIEILDCGLTGMQARHVIPFMKWIAEHEPKLKSLWVKMDLADAAFLGWFLKKCDVKGLDKVTIRLRQHETSDVSEWISAAFVGALFCPSVSNSLAEAFPDADGQSELYRSFARVLPSLDEQAKALGIPYNSEGTVLDLHDVLASHLHNVKELEVPFDIIQGVAASQYVSGALFSSHALPSIETLRLHTTLSGYSAGEDRFDGNCLTKVVGGLKSLKTLTLESPEAGEGDPGFRLFRLHVESETLESLDASDIRDNIWVSCNCPNLKDLSVKAGGARPVNRPPDGVYRILHRDQMIFAAGVVPFVGVDVPDDCLIYFDIPDSAVGNDRVPVYWDDDIFGGFEALDSRVDTFND